MVTNYNVTEAEIELLKRMAEHEYRSLSGMVQYCIKEFSEGPGEFKHPLPDGPASFNITFSVPTSMHAYLCRVYGQVQEKPEFEPQAVKSANQFLRAMVWERICGWQDGLKAVDGGAYLPDKPFKPASDRNSMHAVVDIKGKYPPISPFTVPRKGSP